MGGPGDPEPAGPGAGPVDVEISIVDHQNRDMVRACLRSLPRACHGLTWRVTVIDNVSGDGSLEMLAAEFPEVRVVANKVRLGFGANHNQVLRRCVADGSARSVLVLNDDTELGFEAVTAMVATLDQRPGLGAVAPGVVDPQGRPAPARLAFPTARSWLRTDRYGITELPDPERGWLQGCCLLLRAEALVLVGGFDERFFLFYEDVDLSLRLLQAGWDLGVCPRATVMHHGHATVLRPGIAESTPRQGLRSRYLYFAKHHGARRAAVLSAVGRSVLLARVAKTAAVGGRKGRPAADERARHLLAMARFDPRTPLPQETASFTARRCGT